MLSSEKEGTSGPNLWNRLTDKLFESPGAGDWGAVGMVIGAIIGAVQGWSLLPPETLNIFQLLTATLGLIVGSFVGIFVGAIGWYLFLIGILVAVVFFLGSWLLSN